MDGHGSRRFTEIDAAADRTLEELLGPAGFVATLYRMLDNKESGGLDYTVKLAEMLGEAIGDTSRGEIRRLHDNAARYAKLADEMLSSRFEASLDNLRKAVSGGWLSGGRRLADQYLSHLRHDLEFALVYRVRSHASAKAAELLRRIALDIAESFRQRFGESPMVHEVSDSVAVESELSFRIDEWTREIAGSEFGPDPLEADRDSNDEPDKRARPKRTISSVVFANLDRLRELVGLASAAGGAPPKTGPPPLRPTAIYAALDGASSGPFDLDTLREMVSSGRISRETLVWREGMSDWARAETVPAVTALLDAKPVAAPPPLPPPTPDSRRAGQPLPRA